MVRPAPAAVLSLIVLFLLSIAACGGGAVEAPEAAPEPAGPTPSEAAARAFFDALHAANWEGCAASLHPKALEEFDGVLRGRLIAAAEGGQTEQVLALLDGVDDLEGLRALPPDRFFVLIMSSRSKAQPQMVQMLNASRTEVIGEVAEGDDLRHVVYRMSGDLGNNIKFEEMGVLRVLRDGETWRPMLSDELKRLVQS